jgi:hypothetical protein
MRFSLSLVLPPAFILRASVFLALFVVGCAAHTDDADPASQNDALITGEGPNFASVSVIASNSASERGGPTVVQQWANVMLYGELVGGYTIGGAAQYGCTGSWAMTSHGWFRDTISVSVNCPTGRATEWADWAQGEAVQAGSE